jgi:hypothetical protein
VERQQKKDRSRPAAGFAPSFGVRRYDCARAVITNDIFTKEDMEFLVRSEALAADRMRFTFADVCVEQRFEIDVALPIRVGDALV